MQPFNSFWSFVWACIKTAASVTLGYLKWDVQTVFLGAALLLVGYLIYSIRRGKQLVREKAYDDLLLTLLPLAVVAFALFIFNCIRSPYLVYCTQHGYAKQRIEDADQRAASAEKTKVELEAQLRETKPNLQIEIVDDWVGPAGDKDNAVVGMYTRISNSGASGSLADFWIDVDVDGKILHGQIAPISPNLKAVNFGRNIQGKLMYLPASKYWLSQSLQIPRNEDREGFLMALVKGTTKKEMMDKKAALIFKCSDAAGGKFSSQVVAGAGSDETAVVGLSDLQKPIPKPSVRP
jgi:hypothetical protein